MSASAQMAKALLGRFTASLAHNWRRKLVLAGIASLLGVMGASLALGFDAGVAFDLLRRHHGWLLGFVAGAPTLASMLFMAIYAAAVALSVPGVAILTVIGGYLFGWFHGTALVLVAVTVGASAVFLLTRSALGDGVLTRAGPGLQRFAEGFRRNALSYGFVLNLVPIFPYALIIALPAACGVGLTTFMSGLLLGLIPGTFLFARLGSGLQQVLMSGAPLSLTSFVTPEIVLSLCGLAALALLPVAYRACRARTSAQ
ncbi:MAG: TVP38/TMEM64 family protein [Geminicoccaceae bacterium]